MHSIISQPAWCEEAPQTGSAKLAPVEVTSAAQDLHPAQTSTKRKKEYTDFAPASRFVWQAIVTTSPTDFRVIRGKKQREEIVQRLETQGENFHSTKSVLALTPPFYNQNVSFCFYMSMNYLQDDQAFKNN